MTLRLAAFLTVLAVWALPGRALSCPPESETVIFHSCWGSARVELALLPDALPIRPAPDASRLLVTGSYTGTDRRVGGQPNPVGLFLWRGDVINRNLGRMDGVLIIDSTGHPQIYHRERVRVADETYNLSLLDQRSSFILQAQARNYSIMQSHLLVVDGSPDVAERENAPSHRRRLMFIDEDGFGVWQSSLPVTLHQAAQAVRAEQRPRMALNLDMGSFDYCARHPKGAEESLCGSLQNPENPKLSNLLVFEVR